MLLIPRFSLWCVLGVRDESGFARIQKARVTASFYSNEAAYLLEFGWRSRAGSRTPSSPRSNRCGIFQT